MIRYAIIGAAAMLSVAMAAQAFAQAAIQEPGLYAFYHPDGDLLHAKPQANPVVPPQVTQNGAMAEMRITRPHRRHSSEPRE
jgi:hypothetical protein